MATISISGTNKLAERIISEANADAQKVLDEAKACVCEIQTESDKIVAQKRTELTGKREAAKKGLIGGYETRAALEGKKNVLSKKRAVIDRVFSGAYRALLELNESQRERICENMLRSETEGGETVVPAAADRKAIEAALRAMPEKKLKLSAENASIDGGFQLLANGFEKDCSFASLLELVRGEEETNVAKLLFD